METSELPKFWDFKQFEYNGGVITESMVTRPIIGWQGDNPIILHADGKHEVMPRAK